ncbi:MAG: DUF177 domain-containing protein [Erysipelotrichaceae bacterium]|nr:DUF177 domain-containing protein [Erysipelotrichaceae bacterium]
MRWTKSELINLKDHKVEFNEDITFEPKAFKFTRRLNGLENVHVNGIGIYNIDYDLFDVEMNISGIMITPCAITNDDIDVPFDFDSHVLFSLTDSDDLDMYIVENDIIELAPVIFQLINLEVPLKAVKSGDIEYPKGDGWAIISEEEFERSRKEEIDPRLAKLKEFKFSDDD